MVTQQPIDDAMNNEWLPYRQRLELTVHLENRRRVERLVSFIDGLRSANPDRPGPALPGWDPYSEPTPQETFYKEADQRTNAAISQVVRTGTDYYNKTGIIGKKVWVDLL